MLSPFGHSQIMGRLSRLIFLCLFLSAAPLASLATPHASTASTAATTADPALVQCNGIKDLVFVPHQDDDLLFMNPDLKATIDAGGCLQVVYLTASDRGEGEGYMQGREKGVRAAYAWLAGAADIWLESRQAVGPRTLARITLQGQPRISMLFMRLKDPWLGKGWGSLTPLSRAETHAGERAESLGPDATSYDRAELVATLAAIIGSYQPTTVRHMDDSITVPYTELCWRCKGHDHPDHIASARLVRDAMAHSLGTYAEVAYVDYPSQERSANLTVDETRYKTDAFRHYAWNDYRYCKSAAECAEPAGPAAAWVQRVYYVSRHNAPGVLVPGPDGTYGLVTVGERSRAATVWDSATARWASLSGRNVDHVLGFEAASGRAGVFARDANNGLWVNTQMDATRWTGWQPLASSLRATHLPTVTVQAPLTLVVMGNDGRFHSCRETRHQTGWGSCEGLPPLAGALPHAAIANRADGRTEIFAADSQGRLWSIVDGVGNGGAAGWNAWTPIADAPPTDGGLAAMRDAVGRLQLYVRDAHTGHMLRLVRNDGASGAGSWSSPQDLGFRYVGRPAIGWNERGAVAVAALEREHGPVWVGEAGHAAPIPLRATSTATLRVLGGVLYVAARDDTVDQDYVVMERRQGVWRPADRIGAPPPDGGGPFDQPTRLASAPASIDAGLRAEAARTAYKSQ